MDTLTRRNAVRVAARPLLDRKLSSRRGWRFIMVEVDLNAKMVEHLALKSDRSLIACRTVGPAVRVPCI